MEVHKGEHKFEKIYQEVVEKSTNYQVVAADTDKLLVGTKSSGTITFTLPAVATAKGCTFRFIQTQAENMLISDPEGVMVCKNNAAATLVKFDTSTELIGASAMVICDGTKHYFFNTSGCTDDDGTG